MCNSRLIHGSSIHNGTGTLLDLRRRRQSKRTRKSHVAQVLRLLYLGSQSVRSELESEATGVACVLDGAFLQQSAASLALQSETSKNAIEAVMAM